MARTTQPTAMPQTAPMSFDVHERTLEALFDADYDRIVRYCVVRTGSNSIAQEIAADTFAEAARVCATRPETIDTGWLFMVARRRIIDHWRRAERQRRRIRRLIERHPTEVSLGTDRDDPIVDMVERALGTLPDRQRAALTLRYIDELSVTEVAESLTLSYRATESILARARRSFAKSWSTLS